jgi:hypothetical protein
MRVLIGGSMKAVLSRGTGVSPLAATSPLLNAAFLLLTCRATLTASGGIFELLPTSHWRL